MTWYFQHSYFIGISSLSTLTDPDRLPELPPGEEQRLQRAALHLQQKLILRQWLKDNGLEHHYTRHVARYSIPFLQKIDFLWNFLLKYNLIIEIFVIKLSTANELNQIVRFIQIIIFRSIIS